MLKQKQKRRDVFDQAVKTHHPICQDFHVVFCFSSSSDDRIESPAILRHRLLAHDYDDSVFSEFNVAQWYDLKEIFINVKTPYYYVNKILI